MIKKLTFLLLCMNTQIFTCEKAEKERALTLQIKNLLSAGEMPKEPFKHWCKLHLNTFKESKHEPLQTIGLTLEQILAGSIPNPLRVLDEFKEAAKVHHDNVDINTEKLPYMLTEGTKWYFKDSWFFSLFTRSKGNGDTHEK